MFTAATLQLIRKNSSAEFETLLNRLGIETDLSGNESQLYEKIDGELTRKICGLMKSPTIIDGYMNLLDLGGVTYSYSETDSELLGKIVANRDKILRGFDKVSEVVEVKPQPPKPRTTTKTEPPSWGLRIFGVVLILAGIVGLFLLGIVSLLAIIAGFVLIYLGREKTVTVESPPNPQPTRQAIEAKKTPFTRNELQKTLDVLAQVNKIVRAI